MASRCARESVAGPRLRLSPRRNLFDPPMVHPFRAPLGGLDLARHGSASCRSPMHTLDRTRSPAILSAGRSRPARSTRARSRRQVPSRLVGSAPRCRDRRTTVDLDLTDSSVAHGARSVHGRRDATSSARAGAPPATGPSRGSMSTVELASPPDRCRDGRCRLGARDESRTAPLGAIALRWRRSRSSIDGPRRLCSRVQAAPRRCTLHRHDAASPAPADAWQPPSPTGTADPPLPHQRRRKGRDGRAPLPTGCARRDVPRDRGRSTMPMPHRTFAQVAKRRLVGQGRSGADPRGPRAARRAARLQERSVRGPAQVAARRDRGHARPARAPSIATRSPSAARARRRSRSSGRRTSASRRSSRRCPRSRSRPATTRSRPCGRCRR